MTEQDVIEMSKKVARFREIEHARTAAHQTLISIIQDGPTGPCGQGPFTGNARESRNVYAITIYFTDTAGGSKAVEKRITGLCISAHEFGKFLEEHARDKFKKLDQELKEL